MSNIIPAEAELKAAGEIIHWLMSADKLFLDTETLAVTIATHTRYDGKDAQRWAAECQLAADKGEQFRQRAEAAESDKAVLTGQLQASRELLAAAEAEVRAWKALVQAAEREFPDLDTATVDPSNTLLVDTVRRWVQMYQSVAEKLSGCESIINLMTDQMNWQKQRISELKDNDTTDEERATCGECGSDMTHVRPGKWQCDVCESREYIRREQASRELLAAAEANVREYERTEPLKIAECRRLRQQVAELEANLRTANFPTRQATNCGKCQQYKHTPWKDDEYGYVCATCLVSINDAAIAEAKRKTRQEFADVLRDAKCRCHELVNLHNGIHCEDVKQTIKDIDSILDLSIPPARPAESRSLNRGC